MSAIGISALAHLFGIISIILLLVWLVHYREGIDYDSDYGLRVFDVKQFMFIL
jgi:cytochrome b-561